MPGRSSLQLVHDLGVHFSYKLTGTGWGEADIADEASHIVLPSSYLSDVLGDLLVAIGSLLGGAARADCSWYQEPGEYRWIFDRTDQRVILRILAFDDWIPRQPESEGEEVFRTAGSVGDIAGAIVTGMETVLAEYGEKEYKRRWVEHPFPTPLLQTVKAQLTAL